MKHLFARRSLAWLALVAALLLVVFILAHRPSAALKAWKETMTARGERLVYADLAPPLSLAAVDWEVALDKRVAPLVNKWDHPRELQLMRTNGRGEAFTAWAGSHPIGRKTPSDFWPKFDADMEINEPILAEVEALLAQRPGGSVYDPEKLTALPHRYLTTRRKLVHFLGGATIAALHQQNLERALKHVSALIKLTDSSKVESRLSEHILNGAIVSYGLALTWETLQADRLTDFQLDQLADGWQRVDLITNLARVAELERGCLLAQLAFGRTNGAGLAASSAVPGAGPTPTTELLRDAVVNRLWPTIWSEQEELLVLRAFQPLIEALRIAQTNNAYSAVHLAHQQGRSIQTAELGKSHFKFRRSNAGTFLPTWTKATETVWQQEAFRRVTLCAVALKRHLLRHGRLPEELNALVPELLPAPVMDPMSGGPLIYRRLADTAFLLYSVGLDGKNDGGFGDDIPWPRRAAPEMPEDPG